MLFKREGMTRTFFLFFRSSPNTVYMCTIREMFSVIIFLKIVFILFCASSFKKDEIPVFLQVLELSLYI